MIPPNNRPMRAVDALMKKTPVCTTPAFLALACFGAMLAAQDPPERAPGPGASAHVVYQSKSDGGLRYTWTVPKDYDGVRKCAMTVILHGTGLDYRWGHLNNRPDTFRPDDVVVSVDGTSQGQGTSKLFLGERADGDAFHTFLDEMLERFAVDHVFLYGHSQGSFFAVWYAGEHPTDVDGVVAHASGAWNWSKTGKDLRRVAISFMHGTRDPVVPFAQSVAARDHYLGEGLPLVRLRRLPFYNHWPNGVRADEELSWCEGMTTGDAERTLALAKRIASAKPADEYQWVTVPGFGAARQILRRIETGEPRAFDAPPDAKIKAAAHELAEAIERHAKTHLAALQAQVSSKKQLVFTAKNDWLGHLVALREDFRGVDCVEEYFRTLGWDKLLEQHQKEATPIVTALYGDDDQAACRATLAGLPKAFLFEAFPSDFAERIAAWRGKAKDWKLGKKELAALDVVERWPVAWTEGAKAYEGLWRKRD